MALSDMGVLVCIQWRDMGQVVLGGGAKVCFFVCNRNASQIPIYFLLLPTAHSVWVEKLLTLWLGSPTGPVVHAPLHLPIKT